MFFELIATDFERVRRLFQGHRQYTPVLSVLEGRFPGRVFVDDAQHPSVAIVWAIGRWAYIEGNCAYGTSADSLPELLASTIIPDSLSMGINWFELYARSSNGWIERLDRLLSAFGCTRHFESTYHWNRETYTHFRSQYVLPQDITLKIVDIPVLPMQICESSLIADQFKTSTSVGCRAIMNDEVISLCRSNGFEVGNSFMIDVVTYDKNCRGKGCATAASVGLLDHCVEAELIPLWETTEDNLPSRRLAGKLGFIEDETYPVYSIEF